MSTDPTAQPRVIVLCFDGTANQFDSTNTNVVKFYALLDKCCPLEQIVYYQAGVGTYFNPGVVSPLLTWLAKIADDAIAWYLDEHVMAGYKFLMQNYRAGDKVCLFELLTRGMVDDSESGFSRGAYTARALAGLLHKIGLLSRDNDEQVPFAYSLYKRTDKVGIELAAGFKRTFCAPVSVDFVGVWETITSVGLIYSRSLPFTSANSAVRVFRHAISLDERRVRYLPNLFHHGTPGEVVNGESGHPELVGLVNGTPPESLPAVQEVWFAGCHSDVGAGTVEDTVRYSLGNVSLRWMVKQVILAKCGIKFDAAALRKAGIDISTIVLAGPAQQTVEQLWRRRESDVEGATVSSPSGEGGSEEGMIQRGRGEDVESQILPQEQDALADIHDELKAQPLWWILELMPMKFVWQEADGTWKSKLGINFGRGRQVRSDRPNFHVSVRQRMAVADLKYKPKAKWTPGTERYVE